MNSLPSKRMTLLLALGLVEFLLLIMFTLFYTQVVWVSWDSSKALYGMVIAGSLFFINIFLFIKTLNFLKNATENTVKVQARLISKKIYKYSGKKLFIWKYEYQIDGQPVQKYYWHLNETRKIEENTYFDLFIDKDNQHKNYFFLEDD